MTSTRIGKTYSYKNAIAQRERFFKSSLKEYGARRNHVIPPNHENVSLLSAAHRYLILLEEETARAAMASHPFYKVEKFVQEVYWRLYWKSWLELRPVIWAQYLENCENLKSSLASGMKKRIEKIESGNSGVAVMDYISDELTRTGYIHNHARMWFASYWVHHESLPWELGADFFEKHLLDADPASNTLSWRWVTGIQTPGKTYRVRASNIRKFLESSIFNECLSGIEHIGNLSDPAPPAEVPPKIEVAKISGQWSDELSGENLTRCGLWIHGEDCSLEQSDLREFKFAGIFAGGSCVNPEASPKVHDFQKSALSDAAVRASVHWNCPNTIRDCEILNSDLVSWAKNLGIENIVVIEPKVGYLGRILTQTEAGLNSEGISLLRVRRSSDRTWINSASSGFFKFWQNQKQSLESQ